MNCYAICRMLDGSFTLEKIKPKDGCQMFKTDAKGIKALDRKDAICGSATFVLLEVVAFQEFFTEVGNLTGEERRLLVPAAFYQSPTGREAYVVPLVHADVKLPRMPCYMHEPGGGYVNPTLFSERPKKA